MDDLKIIVFICNWGPHAAFQELQDNGASIPPEVRMIRIPCAGRISKSLLFRAFERGADGVALVGCESGSCRYGSGTETAVRNIDDTRGIIDLLGLGKDRLRRATFLPEESASLLAFLESFRDDVRSMDKSPVAASLREPPKPLAENAAQLMAAHDIYACQDCGKCSSACPLTLVGKPFSPRAMASAIIGGSVDSPSVARDAWSCLTCGLCYDRCPSAVDFPEFIRDLRTIQRARGEVDGREAHGGFFQSLMRTMTSPDLRGKRWNNLPEDVRVDRQSKILFFGGCTPYFDTYFKNHLGISTTDILYDSLRLLNFFDIFPNVLPDERCCGHDLLWSGDRENFLKLARLNMDALEKAGIEEVITACPECYRTLAHDYKAQGVPVKVKVTHIYDLLEKEIDKGAVGFEELDRKLTFQDPCRLSRLENRADLPRKLLNRLKPQDFKEMKDHGVSALCCGNCAWTGCDSYSKALQVKRLQQAREAGSDLLVTACPKCQIHLRCAMEDPLRGEDLAMEMMDLTGVLAKTIKWE
jgi:Fe-S oxidoreductase/coenzyme F420-reducing hydrogenase delta subunit